MAYDFKKLIELDNKWREENPVEAEARDVRLAKEVSAKLRKIDEEWEESARLDRIAENKGLPTHLRRYNI